MRTRTRLTLLPLLIAPFLGGCENWTWGGTEFSVQPPPPPVSTSPEEAPPEAELPSLEPITLGPLLYLVEREGSSRARIVPLAVRGAEGYSALPDPAETPDLVERFPIERWERGTEFILLHGGVRVGTFTADGSTELDESWCRPRAVGQGSLELRVFEEAPERFLALRRGDLSEVPTGLAPHPAPQMTDEIMNASLEAARTLIPRLGIPWPPTVLGIRERVDAFGDGIGARALAASFVYDDGLVIGPAGPNAFSLFVVAREREGEWVPALSWYEQAGASGKAAAGFLGAHDLRAQGEVDLVIEVFGPGARWVAIVPESDDTLVYRDPCGRDPAQGAIRVHR